MTFASILDKLALSYDRSTADFSQESGGLIDSLSSLDQEAEAASFDSLSAVCRQAAELLRAMAEGDSGQEPIQEFVGQIVSYARELAACSESGRDLDELEAPVFPGDAAADDDPDTMAFDASLLEMFIGGCLSMVSDIEGHILAIENSEDADEDIAEVRRGVHTLKGELGVLSLDVAQALFHEAETVIDLCVEKSAPFPIDEMLELLDWIKLYVEALSEDPKAKPADHQDLLGRLKAAPNANADAPTGAAAEETAEATAEATESSDVEAEGEHVIDPTERVSYVVCEDFVDSLPDFITESRGHLAVIEEALLEYENDQDLEAINRTFRGIHTIKGVAGFLNLDPIVRVAHQAETLLDGARSELIVFTSKEVDLVLASSDMLNTLINGLDGGELPLVIDVHNLVLRLTAACDGAATSSGQETEAGPATVAVDPVVAEVEQAAPETIPGVVAEAVKSPDSKPVTVPATAPKAKAPAAKSGGGTRVKIDQTIKVSTKRLDMLVDMVGELVIAQSMVLQDKMIQNIADQVLNRNINQVSKITRDLQEASMSLRMVTVKSTFQKMARLVRDVSSKAGKTVNLVIEGEDTELDRNVVEEIADPLVHMIRNAVDHGIEIPEDRTKVGKTPEGHLHLRAYHQGGSIIIEIRDDGRGLNRERILEKAVERNLLPPNKGPEDMQDHEIYNLIFQPGFSTAEKVTDLSGRGVGMDVVRRNIEALRGKVEIMSEPGRGTRFLMRLPLTLAIIDGMIVTVGGQRYVVPTLSIEQSLSPDPKDVHYIQDQGEVIKVRGAILPVYRLKDVFEREEGASDITDGILIVLEVNNARVCLMVDEILGQQQVVIKNLGLQNTNIRGVSGGAIMGDGKVALIIDVEGLVEEATAVMA